MIDPSSSLNSVLDRARAEAEKHGPARVFEAAAGLTIAQRYKDGLATGEAPLTKRYKKGEDILAALAKGSLDVRECAVSILAKLDPASAIEIARALVLAPKGEDEADIPYVSPDASPREYRRMIEAQKERARSFATRTRQRARFVLHELGSDLPSEAPAARAEKPAAHEEPRPAGAQSAPTTAIAAGPPVAQDKTYAAALERMERARENLARIVERLREGGYVFRYPDRALEPPPADVEDQLARLEELAGGPLPLSLRAFYARVGSVNLEQGERPERALAEGDDDPVVTPFRSFGAHDPLVVYGVESAVADVETWRKRWANQPREAAPPIHVVISVEAAAKAIPANGSDYPYRIAIPSPAADAPLVGEPRGLSFVDYLRLSLRWGGFSGFAGKLDPLLPKLKSIAKKKHRTADEWHLLWVDKLTKGSIDL